MSQFRVGLYDVDSKIPNLALMKLSTWHKQRGHHTELYSPLQHHTYNKVYASKVFKFSSSAYIRDDMIVGGTGVSLDQDLAPEVEELDPDYELYGYPHNIGFAMRGCRFKCSFCVVPQKEGKPVSNSSIAKIWTQRSSNFLYLLDNDFFGNPNWESCIEEIREYKLKVNFSQGLNIRIISEKQAKALASVNFSSASGKNKSVTFAWDNIKDERTIRRGFNRVIEAGLKPYQIQFYVLIGYDSTPEEDMHRVMMIHSWDADPFVMAYNKDDPYQRKFQRWVNHKALFKSTTFDEYRGYKKNNQIQKHDPNQLDLFPMEA